MKHRGHQSWERAGAVGLLIWLILMVSPRSAVAHDLPNQIVMQALVRPQGDRLHALLRIPLIMLLNVDLPKRGPGYLDLAKVGDLEPASAAASRAFALYEDGTRLQPLRAAGRISLPSDDSFESYSSALANIRGPRLPNSTNVFWNQGFFDVHLMYPVKSSDDFTLDLRMPSGIEERLKTVVRFMSADGEIRAYALEGEPGPVALDPSWFQATWTFMKSGFLHILGGADHLLFLLCLLIPFHHRLWGLLPVITSFTIAHSITLVAATYDLVPSDDWFPPLVETLIAASIVYMAIENIISNRLKRRWLITGIFGLVHGLGFSYGLQQEFQFAGDHLLASLVSFNLGVEMGQIFVLAISLPLLWVVFSRQSFARYGVAIVSAIAAHTAWHWMVDRFETLRAVRWPALDPSFVASSARWLAVFLIAGGAFWLVAKRAPDLGHGVPRGWFGGTLQGRAQKPKGSRATRPARGSPVRPEPPRS